jgi:hypothetical protein
MPCLTCHSRNHARDRAVTQYAYRNRTNARPLKEREFPRGTPADPRRILLALQYYNGDRTPAQGLVDLICKLAPKPYKTVDFLLSARLDADPPDRETLEQLEKTFDNAVFFRGRRRANGWPHAPNELWHDTVQFIYEMDIAQKLPRYSGIQFLESDDTPLCPDWVERLTDEWIKLHTNVMGHLLPSGWRDHINGNCMISGSPAFLQAITRIGGAPPAQGWDWAIAPRFKAWGWSDTFAIRSDWNCQSSPAGYLELLLAQGTVLHHGVKDGSLKRQVRRKYLPEDKSLSSSNLSYIKVAEKLDKTPRSVHNTDEQDVVL